MADIPTPLPGTLPAAAPSPPTRETLTPVQAALRAAELRASAPPINPPTTSASAHSVRTWDPTTFNPPASDKLPLHRILDAEVRSSSLSLCSFVSRCRARILTTLELSCYPRPPRLKLSRRWRCSSPSPSASPLSRSFPPPGRRTSSQHNARGKLTPRSSCTATFSIHLFLKTPASTAK